MKPCPICGTTDLDRYLSREHVAEEMAMRPRFFEERIEGKLDDAEKIDRVIVSRHAGAQLLICRACGVLVRDEEESPDFMSEAYADFMMERMLHAHADAYRAKAPRYRALLPEGARVIEVGSYVGGFLHVANEWGWQATGVDVGRDTAHFTRSRGYDTCDRSLRECAFDERSADAVFIWNAFEQLDPNPLLDEVRRVLRDKGLLVVRVPNAAYYERCQKLLPRPLDPHDEHAIALGHANLLGFPHLYGYSPDSLDRLMSAHSFTREAVHADHYMDPLHGRLTMTALRERERIEGTAGEAARHHIENASWFEAVYRLSR